MKRKRPSVATGPRMRGHEPKLQLAEQSMRSQGRKKPPDARASPTSSRAKPTRRRSFVQGNVRDAAMFLLPLLSAFSRLGL
jgi:hypothetical protein